MFTLDVNSDEYYQILLLLSQSVLLQAYEMFTVVISIFPFTGV